MKLIVGLGNPGRRYQGTRHNVGFDVLAEVGRRLGAPAPRSKFQAELSEARLGGEKLLLLLPLTFMNRSGESVQPARDFYQLENQDVLIVCDDFNLPLPRLRFRPRGSAGGQNGLADVLQRLGNQDVPRLRIGIGPVPAGWSAPDYVLGRFSAEEQSLVVPAVKRAADAVADWVENGTDYCMNHYNGETP